MAVRIPDVKFVRVEVEPDVGQLMRPFVQGIDRGFGWGMNHRVVCERHRGEVQRAHGSQWLSEDKRKGETAQRVALWDPGGRGYLTPNATACLHEGLGRPA